MAFFDVKVVSTEYQRWALDDPVLVESLLGETSVDVRMEVLRWFGTLLPRPDDVQVEVVGVDQALK